VNLKIHTILTTVEKDGFRLRPFHPLLMTLVYLKKKNCSGLGVVAQACNPSYFGGGDQEDYSSRPAWAKSS
jgi:hypothetical protein